MYRIIRFEQGKGKTLARFSTEEEVTAFHGSTQEQSKPAGGEATKKHCIVEFERGTDNCMMLGQFDTPEEAAKYYQTVKDKHEPFGPLLVLPLEQQPGGDYDELRPKPHYRQAGGRGGK